MTLKGTREGKLKLNQNMNDAIQILKNNG